MTFMRTDVIATIKAFMPKTGKRHNIGT